MDGFIGAAALALISAISWIAYKHPQGYIRISIALSATILIVFFCLVAYDIGAQSMQSALREHIESGSIGAAYEAADRVRPNMLYVFLAIVGSITYLGILGALPYILRSSKKEQINDECDKAD